MASVCQKCGDRGYSWLLVFCSGCNNYAEHQYCLDEIPKEDEENIRWLCEECEPCNTPFVEDEEYEIPNDESMLQSAGTYLFRDREKSKISNGKDIVGCRKLLNGNRKQTYVSQKKKRKLSLPPKPHKPFLQNGEETKVSKHGSLQPKLGGYLFRDREKHAKKMLNHENINGKTETLNRKSKLLSDIPGTHLGQVSQRCKEVHMPPFKHLGLMTWGRYKKRLNRGKSSLGIATNSLKGDVALPYTHDLKEGRSNEGVKSSAQTRKFVLSVESGKNIAQYDREADDCKSLEESEAQSKEGRSSVSLEYNGGSNSRKRKSENRPGVDERSTTVVISQPVEEKVEPTNEFYYVSAWPIVNYSWRGFFKTGGKSFGPFNAHLSTKACEKAWNATKTLPPIVHFSMESRSQAWPKSVEISPPTDDHIALFFFPCYSWVEQMVEPLLQEIVKGDCVLKVVMGDAELLVLPSTLLPHDYQKFEDRLYLWGSYKSRKPNPSKPATNKQDQHAATNHSTVSINPLKTKQTEPCETCHKNHEKNRGEEDNESSHLTDESSDIHELLDSANKKSRKNELDLFPVQVENIALRSKLGEGKKRLDLELGLSLPFTQ